MENCVSKPNVIEAVRRFPGQEKLEVCLNPGEVVALGSMRKGMTIVSRRGILWVTQEGDPIDYILKAGEAFTLSRPGPIVVEGMLSNN